MPWPAAARLVSVPAGIMGDVPKVKLTKTAAAAAPPGITWDAELPGFGLRVGVGGRRSWIVQYRLGGRASKQRRMKLGTFPPVTPHIARARAAEALRAVAAGEDPQGAKLAARLEPLTFGEVLDLYLEHLRTKRKASTLEVQRRFIARALVGLRGLPIDQVTPALIDSLHREMEATPTDANQVLATTTAAWNRARKLGRIPDGLLSPARHVERYRTDGRTRYLTEAEIHRFGAALRELERSGKVLPQYALALRLLLLTGMRPGEVMGLRWSEVDIEKRAIVLADSKTGPRSIPLGEGALALLRATPREVGRDLVAPGARDGRISATALCRAARRVFALAEIEGAVVYTLRHTWATMAVAGGESLRQIGGVMGHRAQATTEIYAHLMPEGLRRVAEGVSGRIAELERGGVN